MKAKGLPHVMCGSFSMSMRQAGSPAFLAAHNLNVQVLPGLKILKKEERFGKQERFMVV